MLDGQRCRNVRRQMKGWEGQVKGRRVRWQKRCRKCRRDERETRERQKWKTIGRKEGERKSERRRWDERKKGKG